MSRISAILRLGAALPLSGGERMALLALLDAADDGGETQLSASDVAKRAALAGSAAARALRRLWLMGFVRSPSATSPVALDLGRIDEVIALLGGANAPSAEPPPNPAETPAPAPRAPDSPASAAPAAIAAPPPAAAPRVRTVVAARPADWPAEPPPRAARAVPLDWAAFERFRAAYPRKAPQQLAECKAAYSAAVAKVGERRLMAALEAFKATKQANEEGGRYVPRPEIWLQEERFAPFLDTAAAAEEVVGTPEWERANPEAALEAQREARRTRWAAFEAIVPDGKEADHGAE